jgi:hypothetical protein
MDTCEVLPSSKALREKKRKQLAMLAHEYLEAQRATKVDAAAD